MTSTLGGDQNLTFCVDVFFGRGVVGPPQAEKKYGAQNTVQRESPNWEGQKLVFFVDGVDYFLWGRVKI